MPRLGALLVCLLVLLAGCLGGPSSTADSAEDVTSTAATETPTPHPTPTPQPRMRVAADSHRVDCGYASVGIYDPSGPTFQSMWDRETVRMGAATPMNRTVLFVVTEENAVLGVESWSYGAAEIDGATVELDRPLYGDHTIRVTMYADRDGDAELDPETDAVCTRDGTPVRTDPTTVDFDEAARNGSATP